MYYFRLMFEVLFQLGCTAHNKDLGKIQSSNQLGISLEVEKNSQCRFRNGQLVTQIHYIQQRSAWSESFFYVSGASYITTLLKMDLLCP